MKPRSVAVVLTAFMCLAAVAGVVGRPTKPPHPEAKLETSVPEAFGDWKVEPEQIQAVPPLVSKVYDEVLTRTYANKDGYRIMLSLAYGSDQRGGLQAHRQEVCYTAQGFKVGAVTDEDLSTPFGAIPVRKITASQGARNEPVIYWLTIADHAYRNQFEKRLIEIRFILTGQIPDGLLFRVSSIDGDAKRAFEMQEQFVADMLAAVPAPTRRRLSGLTARR